MAQIHLSGGAARKSRFYGETNPVRDTVISFVGDQVLVTQTAIAKGLRIRTGALSGLLEALVRDGTLVRAHLRTRIHYLLASSAWRMCRCDGRCVEQMAALRDPGRRFLLRKVHRLGRFNTWHVRSQIATRMSWSRSMTHHHLQRLVDAGILSRVKVDHSDRRLAWYRTEPFLPPVLHVLLERSPSLHGTPAPPGPWTGLHWKRSLEKFGRTTRP